MKKTIYIATMLLSMMLFGSCNDWLDVKPATETKKEDLFKTQEGFRDALTGAYIHMKSSDLYGEHMLFGNIEKFVQHWTLPDDTDPWKTYNYSSKELQDIIRNLFLNLYSGISDVNNILEVIDHKKDLFEEGWFELIKGEALAMRAYYHLDVLRMWGPIPGEIPEGLVLPYVKTVTTKPHQYHTYQDYIAFLEEDLNEAEKLLKEVDPILQYSIEALNNPGESSISDFNPKDRYWAFRQVRMNYYGVLALKARFYLWTDNKPEANKYARMVIDAKDIDGIPTFSLGRENDITSTKDYALCREHIMGLDVYNLESISKKKLQTDGVYEKGTDYVRGQIFEASATDIRFLIWEHVAKDGRIKFIIRKYQQPESNQKNQVPLIRLVEMYFIAMETDMGGAQALYNSYCLSRNIVPKSFTTEDELKAILIKEYNKEFYAEGQMFYAYKRLNWPEITGYIRPVVKEIYLVPLPLEEIR